jgi:signal transduction histidine kinase
VRHILAGVFLPQLIIIPVIAIIIGFGISRGLQPVERLSQSVRTRNINQLEPISTAGTARELRPMVDAINDLMGRVSDAMRIEKNFTNYAAHEMRTPIAALKTQAQVILRTHDAEKQKQLASELLLTIDRTQRIIEQLLTYARVQHQQVVLSPVNLRALVLDEVRHVVPRAMDKQVTIDAEDLAECTVPVQEDLLRLALSNVLDNAVKYIGEGGRIVVNLTYSEDGAVLAVRDDGPGVRPEDRMHLFDPFYRVTGNKAPGAGLGLAIVKWACDLQHIAITVESGLDGRGLGTILHIVAS